MELLTPATLGRLERLQLSTRRALTGTFSGEHRSRRHGTSLDFADYREYHPGDDYRRIDYNLLARLDVLALKLFEAEDDLHIRLLVDTSASMGSGDKLTQAARIGAALGFVALVRRDSVSVHAFPTVTNGRRYTGRHAAPELFDHLESLTASGTTPFASAASELMARPGPRGLTVVLSDLLTPEWETAISRLPARGDDVFIVHLVDPADLDPTEYGDLDLVDTETGDTLAVSLSDENLDTYRAAVAEWLDEIALRCRQVNAAYALVRSDADVESMLLTQWCDEGLLR